MTETKENTKEMVALYERIKTQMTVGKLIDELKKLDPNMRINSLGYPHLFLKYKTDLGLQMNVYDSTIEKTIDFLSKNCIGRHFIDRDTADGWRRSGKHTPVWINDFGTMYGQRVLGVRYNKDLNKYEFITQVEL